MDADPDPYLQAIVLFKGITPALLIPLFILLLLLAVSALFSSAEVAIFSLKINDLESLKVYNKALASKLYKIYDDKKKTLATILIGNNLVNVSIVILSTYLSDELFDFQGNENVKLLFELFTITSAILIFGEIVPKILATKFKVQLSQNLIGPIQFFTFVFKPVIYVLLKISDFLDNYFKRKYTEKISVDDLTQALEITSADAEPTETSLYQEIVRFGTITVKQVMTPRMDICGVSCSSSFADVLREIRNTGYSRLPVYENDLDHITGILYIKDILLHIDKEDFDWKSKIRPAYFVPESKKIDDLLQEFRQKKIHIAIVIDEYGGTSGLVTLEDVIEEVVGEINDEFDMESPVYTQIDENNYIFEGKTGISEFCKIMNVDDEMFDDVKGDAETLGGLILEIVGNTPSINQEIEFMPFTFKVESFEKRRIRRVKVTKHTE
ncbi:MAG: gliding motility-associated protein GldE [Thermaurantimonas sp.]|uniref:gliding motility-associated protein GldE n=1 Tax=Thermaurantimonas sp. TaxID=2681568 RepID=UPI00391C1C03